MSDTRHLLLEIGTEELPPKALTNLSQAFKTGIEQALVEADLAFTQIAAYAAPRRLAVVVSDLALSQPDRAIERRGPALKSAYDEAGEPTKALQGFARSCGVAVEALTTLETEKGTWLVFRQQQKGAETASLIPDILAKVIASLPIPKRMRWANVNTEFVRPVHWIVALLGERVLPIELFGVKSGRDSYGHRFHHPEKVVINQPEDYVTQMKAAYVMVDMSERAQAIEKQVTTLASELGGSALIEPDLLTEVVGLVEWPVALSGTYDDAFLALPAEVLISSMASHQKYFAVKDQEGALLPYFITVCNIESADPSQVIAGNERVIRPRLSDAAFFWETDRKTTLAAHQDKLDKIVFQNQLGSIGDKVRRVTHLAVLISGQIGGDPRLTERAGQLSKCDLTTEMVAEFPDLQGVMGRYYAQLDGEPEPVCQAIAQQYQPRFSGDSLPSSAISQALSLAEKIDTLVGLFGIGQPPTGMKDPFALRRAALGVLRILIEQRLALDLRSMISEAAKQLRDKIKVPDVEQQVLDYCNERLRGYAIEKGYRQDHFDSVLAVNPTAPIDFMARLEAVVGFSQLAQANALAEANKRIANILRKNPIETELSIDKTLLIEPAEQQLVDDFSQIKTQVAGLQQNADYVGVLNALAAMGETIEAFFAQVRVIAEDPAVKFNRLSLLAEIRALFLTVADISQIQG